MIKLNKTDREMLIWEVYDHNHHSERCGCVLDERMIDSWSRPWTEKNEVPEPIPELYNLLSQYKGQDIGKVFPEILSQIEVIDD